MCIYYKIRKNKKYTITKKNGGNVPVLRDKRQEYNKNPCGQCYVCKRKLAREWKARLSEDLKVNKNAKVVLLTFSTKGLKEVIEKGKLGSVKGYELDNQICKWAVKHFRERWRKKYDYSPRHWLVTELGQKNTEHVHMHGLIWIDKRYNVKGDFLDEVEKIWKYGIVGRGRLNWETGKYDNWIGPETAGYFVKYINKTDPIHKEYKQIRLVSPGIGECFLKSNRAKDNRYKGEQTNQMYNVENGGVLPMPEYWRRKMYSDDEREKLTGYMLDKGLIYIDGKEYRGNYEDDKISKTLITLREKNSRLGYGDGTKNWERIKIENERRKQKYEERGIQGYKIKEDRFEKRMRIWKEMLELKYRRRKKMWDRFARSRANPRQDCPTHKQ